jgi:hypothetical protein
MKSEIAQKLDQRIQGVLNANRRIFRDPASDMALIGGAAIGAREVAFAIYQKIREGESIQRLQTLCSDLIVDLDA